MWPDLTKAGFHTHNSRGDLSPPLNFYINELTIHVCIIANVSLVSFSWGLFLEPVWCARVLRWSTNDSGVNEKAPIWLEIATRLAGKLGHQIGYYLWYLELKLASGESFWQCQLLHPWFPTTPTSTPIWSFVTMV